MLVSSGLSLKNCLFRLLRTLTFLIALQQWNFARADYTELVAVVTHAKPPGEMEPKSLSILIGENATITCRLSEANSTKIWFYEDKSKRHINQPAKDIEVLDDYTAKLHIQNANEQKSFYQCMVGNQAIGVSELYVGTMPQNVSDFRCLVYDYEYMQCSFTRPKNMLLTTFDLVYRFADDSSVHKCDLHEVVKNKLQCNISDYFPVRDKYFFTLVGTNIGGQNAQNVTINNHKIVIPSALDISVVNVNCENVTLTWEKLKIGYYRMGLRYDIQISDNHSDWHTPQRSEELCKNGTCHIVLSNLYAFWTYKVKVRVMSKSVDKSDQRMWSEASTKQFRTKGRPPRKSPDVPSGSFYIDSTETQLRLYWGQMDEREYCGPGFHYIVNEINSNGVVIHSARTNETALALPWKNYNMLLFSIKAANDYGESSEGNTLRVFRSGSARFELKETNIAKVYHNSSYTLSWSPPENVEDLVNYTVFWCLQKIELPNQCKGPISFRYLDKFTTNFTTEPRDRSLNLAISANYLNYNKGMQWARCSGVSSELMKTELELSVLNESSVLVKWSSGSVCPFILEGYNLTYCLEPENSNCVRQRHTIPLLRQYRNYTISKLPSYKRLCVSMFMYSTTKRGPDSDFICVRTRASAPSSPKHLKLVPNSVTSKSATITWDPPDIHNGILSHYTIYCRKIPDGTYEYNSTVPINQTSFTLTSLNSFSSYEVCVTANTIAESRPSKHIKMSTLIGIPSSPRNVNIYDNVTFIYWDKPDLPSGRHVFYVVALLRRYNVNESTYDRVSIVGGRSCKFQLPDCSNPQTSFALEVRAVSVADDKETDTDIKSISRGVILAGASIDQSFCSSTDDGDQTAYFLNKMTKVVANEKFFASPWIHAQRDYFCPTGSNASFYAVAFVIAIAFAVYSCYWIRNKYYKMKNIKVILPEGLVDQVANYKFGGNTLGNDCNLENSSKKDFHCDISRSNDCLVAFGHKESHNLISNFHNRSANALSSLSSNNSSKELHNDDPAGEHPSLETTNEDLSSNSSSNSNLTYHNRHHIERLSSLDSTNTLAISTSDRDEERYEQQLDIAKENGVHNLNVENSGYVTHNTQLLASLLKVPERNVSPPTQLSTIPAMTNDGYIQPSAAKQLFQPQAPLNVAPPVSTLNGYTSIEALGKMSTMSDVATQNHISPISIQPPTDRLVRESIPAANMSITHTSPVITDLQESDHNKDINSLSPSAPSAASATQQPNNNNNTIYGYVTQQQLANFGTNVALGKELNT